MLHTSFTGFIKSINEDLGVNPEGKLQSNTPNGVKIEHLKKVVAGLTTIQQGVKVLYDAWDDTNNELNDMMAPGLQSVIAPMSIDEWYHELYAVIEQYEEMIKKLEEDSDIINRIQEQE
jgi:hypothetical protein